MADVLAADDADFEAPFAADFDAGHAASRMFAELRRGTRLGRYELLVPIATGGMARVWAARQHGQRGFSKLVALKTILPHLAREPEFERMFLDEARIASLVHHPNVAEIYELGEECFHAGGPSVLYLAMEWVDGDSLMHVLRNGVPGTSPVKRDPLDARIAVRIVADAAGGLHAAHELKDDDGVSLGVVHRDVSPHNLLISNDGHVKVADFGVAKALGGMQSQTAVGQLKGKISYMAPEQVTGSAVNRTSDVFALGCVLYEATVGAPPFAGEGDHQVMHALVTGKYAAPSQALAGFPRELESLLVRALSNDQKDRFPSAEAMRVALEEWLASSGPMVTSTHVAAAVRARVGAVIDARKEKIRSASSASSGAAEVYGGASDVSTSLHGSDHGRDPNADAVSPSPWPAAAEYGSSSGIQRMPVAVARFGGPTPSIDYDPRQSVAAGASATLPLGAVYNHYAPGYAAHASPTAAAMSTGAPPGGGYDPRLSSTSATKVGLLGAIFSGSAHRYVFAAAIGVVVAIAVGVLLIVIVELMRSAAPAPTHSARALVESARASLQGSTFAQAQRTSDVS